MTYHAVGKPAAGGKVLVDETTGNFTFLPHSDEMVVGGADQFRVLITEHTWFDRALENVPVVGKYLIKPILVDLHRVPIIRDLLSPLIGRSAYAIVNVDVGQFVGPGETPIAFTTTVTSFDKTPISVNYFPTIGLGPTDKAPTVLNGPSLATAGYTNIAQESSVLGLVPGLTTLRARGYNVVTWDPRGEFASGGILHLDSFDYEARDVQAIIDWVAKQPGTQFDPGAGNTISSSDPRVGMVGGSYGGGIQLTSAGIDKRIDAIVPGIAWNNLSQALFPNNAFKTSWASLLLLSLVSQGARIDDEIYKGIFTGILTGRLTEEQQEFLSGNSPFNVIDKITAPTLFLQGTVDGLFTLQQALQNAAGLNDAVPMKMIWYCGGHGSCLDPVDTDGQSDFLINETMEWLNTYVMNKTYGTPPPIDEPKFTWIDQKGDWYAADLLPTDGAGFYDKPIELTHRGGLLPIAPGHNGSGPQTDTFFPLSLTLAAPADRAINIPVSLTKSTPYLVGAPEVTLKYAGLGTSRNVYAQLVDNNTNRVVGNLITPIEVKLDGKTHGIKVSMENIAYTVGDGDSLTLQIVDSATAYKDFSAYGIIAISEVKLSIPTAAHVIPLDMESLGVTAKPTATSLEDLLLGAHP